MNEIEIPNPRGQKLPATLRKGPGPVVIVCHGFQSTRQSEMTRTLAETLHATGFTTVSFDFNGHGENQSKFADFTMTKALHDVQAVIQHVKERFPGRKIGLVGNSTGGTVALMAAAQDPQVKALVLHAPLSDFEEAIRLKARKRFIPKWLVRPLWKTVGAIPYDDSHETPNRLKYAYYEDGLGHDVLGAAERIRVPVLIIHSKKDPTVPFTQSEALKSIMEGGTSVEFEPHADGGHEFTGTQLGRYAESAARFLKKHLH